MRLKNIMTTDVATVAESESIAAARSLLRSRKIRHLVVSRGGVPSGVISDRDLRSWRGDGNGKVRYIAELMTPSAVCATPETSVREAARLMRGRGIGCLPIIDGKKLVGIVTVSDLLDLLAEGGARPATPARSARSATAARGTLRKLIARGSSAEPGLRPSRGRRAVGRRSR